MFCFIFFQKSLKPKEVKRPKVASQVDVNNSEKLTVHKSSFYQRINQTIDQIENIHCSADLPTNCKDKAIIDGLWVTFINKCTPAEIKRYTETSQKAKSALTLSKQLENPDQEEVQLKRWRKSLILLFKGSMITQDKYQVLRNYEKENKDLYSLLPYRQLIRLQRHPFNVVFHINMRPNLG